MLSNNFRDLKSTVVRTATIKIETSMNQVDFETWLLETLKQISVYPDTTEVIPSSLNKTDSL